ncbi:uncharacterized protein LOC131848795 [Achroia grisella]|uniref:uncharacterized protein LOC131848795 n=1 Tax=Achroia grisella TaxID=688607 RepID=UPI0027D2B7FC|nr:uncharacterized protein LOC131848795 [Achroia grisella]
MTTVKCNNCNVVINELLAFVQNKADIMDEDSINRLCVTAFSEEEIALAKKLLFESVDTSRRKIKRRKEGKSLRDLVDIIALIKETDPEIVPIFVARELHKLPPVTFDHLDATKLLRDIIKLQDDVATVKEKYISREELISMKLISTSDGCNLNRSREKCPKDNTVEHIQMGATSATIENQVSSEDNSVVSLMRTSASDKQTECDKAIRCRRVEATTVVPTITVACETASPMRPVAESDKDIIVRRTGVSNEDAPARAAARSSLTPNRKQLSDLLRDGSEWKKEVHSEEWTKVQRKRYRNRFIGLKGKAELLPNCSFKAADIDIPFYIYNVNKETRVEDIAVYIKNKTSVSVSLLKIDMKINKEYAAYKFMIPKSKLNVFMNENLWPDGIAFRRFVTYKSKVNKQEGKYL